jgi:hypothetical protein
MQEFDVFLIQTAVASRAPPRRATLFVDGRSVRSCTIKSQASTKIWNGKRTGDYIQPFQFSELVRDRSAFASRPPRPSLRRESRRLTGLLALVTIRSHLMRFLSSPAPERALSAPSRSRSRAVQWVLLTLCHPPQLNPQHRPLLFTTSSPSRSPNSPTRLGTAPSSLLRSHLPLTTVSSTHFSRPPHRFGNATLKPQSHKFTSFVPSGLAPDFVFVFQYKSRSLLQAMGIVPAAGRFLHPFISFFPSPTSSNFVERLKAHWFLF